MLVLKRAQLERSLHEEEARLRHVESRIAQIDREGTAEGFDVIVKSVPAMPFLSLNCTCKSMDEAVRMVRTVAEEGARQIKPALATSSSWSRETTSTPRSSISTSAFR